jgi:hypothetical protein
MSRAAKKFLLTVAAGVMVTAVVADWKWRFDVNDRLARIETSLKWLAEKKVAQNP